MRVSPSELVALFKQSLEGLGLDTGVYENAAEAMVWAQMHNLDIFTQLEPAIQQCAKIKRAELKFIVDQDLHCQIQVADEPQSCVLWGGAASYIAVAKARQSGFCVTEVERGFGAELLLKRMSESLNFGLVSALHWQNDDSAYLVRIYPQGPCPEIIRYQKDGDRHHRVTQIYSSNDDILQDHLDRHFPVPSEAQIQSPAELEQAYADNLNNGIAVDQQWWNKLSKIAENVLLESSEQSRKGAGA